MEHARTTEGKEKEMADAEVERLILKLWSMRADLPGHVDPDKRLGKAIRALEQLDQERSVYQPPLRGSVPALNAAAKARQDIATINVQLTVLLVAEEYDRAAADEEGLPLSSEAVDLRELLDEKMLEFIQGRIFVRSAKDAEPLDRKAMAKIKIEETLGTLRASLAIIEAELRPPPSGRKRKKRPAAKPHDPMRGPSHRKI